MLLFEMDNNVLSPPLVKVVEMYVLSVCEADVLFPVSVLLIDWYPVPVSEMQAKKKKRFNNT